MCRNAEIKAPVWFYQKEKKSGSCVCGEISRAKGGKNNRRWFDCDEKGKHLFMSLIQWQDRTGHLSPTDNNHL